MQTLLRALPSPSFEPTPCDHAAKHEADVDFERVARHHAAALYIRAFRFTGSRFEAWDLVQDTFERALRTGLSRVPEDKRRAWLGVVMRNLYLDRLRQARRSPEVMVSDETLHGMASPDPEPHAPWRLVSDERLAASMAALPAKFRVVYEMRVVEGLGNAQIAARLGLPVATVATRLFRARQRLHQALRVQASSSAENERAEEDCDDDAGADAVEPAGRPAALITPWAQAGTA